MKALILATDFFTQGGIARYTSTLASALGDILGPGNVQVLALLNTGHSSESDDSSRVLKALSNRPTFKAKVGYIKESLRFSHACYDLIICSHVALAPVAAIIRRLLHTPFWVACHDAEVWDRIPFHKLAALRRAQFALPVSRFTAETLLENNGISPTKIRVIHNAIPDEFIRMLLSTRPVASSCTKYSRGNRYLLSVGSLARAHSYKGFDTVIRALPRLTAGTFDLHYVIVGTGDNQPRLEALASEMGVRHKVTFAGQVSDRELADLYLGCEAFVMPSRTSATNGRRYGEGFGRVYVEAALAGKPVVGSTGGGAAEAVLHGKTGLVVDPTSGDQVTNALSILVHDPYLAQTMGREGRLWAQKNFSEESLRSNLAGVLREGGYLQ